MNHARNLTLILASSLLGIGYSQKAESIEPDRSGEVAEFRDASGLRLKYPRSWKIQKKPDRDTLAKFSGQTAPNVESEISVSLLDDGGLNVADFVKMFDGLLFSKINGVRKSALKPMYFGSSGRLPGQLRAVSFTMQGMPIYQEYLFVPAKNKILVATMTTQNWQRPAVEGVWKTFLDSIDAPENMIAKASLSEIAACKPEVNGSVCNIYAECVPIQKPLNTMTLDQKIKAILPRPEEERFLQIPWRTDLLSARLQSERTGKPMFIWIMDGNVLGAT